MRCDLADALLEPLDLVCDLVGVSRFRLVRKRPNCAREMSIPRVSSSRRSCTLEKRRRIVAVRGGVRLRSNS